MDHGPRTMNNSIDLGPVSACPWSMVCCPYSNYAER